MRFASARQASSISHLTVAVRECTLTQWMKRFTRLIDYCNEKALPHAAFTDFSEALAMMEDITTAAGVTA